MHLDRVRWTPTISPKAYSVLSWKSNRELHVQLVVTLLFWLATRLGQMFSDDGYLTPVWPPAAIACVAGLLYGPRSLLGAAAFMVWDFDGGSRGDWSHERWAAVAPLALLTSAAASRRIALRAGFSGRLDSLRAVLVMMGLGVLFAVVNGAGAAVAECGRAVAQRCAIHGRAGYWLQATFGDVFGCVVCMPALLSWARWADASVGAGLPARPGDPAGGPRSVSRRPAARPGAVLAAAFRLSREQWLFVAAGLAATALAGVVTRWGVPVHVAGFLALPLLVWAAFKFPPLFVHTAVLACGLIALGLQLGAPLSAVGNPAAHAASLFLFLLSASTLTLIVNVVVQQQRRLARELAFRVQQERVEMMLQAASDAVISFDERGVLSYWNPAAERLFGRSAAHALGRPVGELLPLPELLQAGDGIGALCAAGAELFSGAVIDVVARDARGAGVAVELSLSAYRNDRGWAVTAFMRDARSHKRQQEALRLARDRAEEATRAKSLFLATMSHELRTPLSGVIGMLQLGLRESLPASARSRLALALGNAEALLAIVNDLLDFSKIEAGKMSFEEVDFDLRELVASLVELLDLRAQEAGLCLSSQVDAEVPRWLRGDPVRLRQILLNLLGNALKFTEAGSVHLRVGCGAEETGRLHLEFEVADTGIGISEEAQLRLFSSFEQADPTTSRKYGGTGLGLTITRALVDGMHGTITLRSRLGEGSTFRVALPMAVGAPVPAVSVAPPPPFDCRLNVLCAEDGHTNRVIVQALVQDLGHEVAFVENGAQAVRRCAAEDFDVLLMDCRMPVMDGPDAARAIRAGGSADARVRDPAIWMIALTANAADTDRALSLAAGMDDFLSKPVDEHELARALHRAVEALRARGRALRPAPAAAQALFVDAEPDAASVDAAQAVLAAARAPVSRPATRPLAERLAEAFRSETPRLLEELGAALAAHDLARAARLAHNIKGSAFYIRGERMAEHASALEEACEARDEAALPGHWRALQESIEDWLTAR